MKLFLSNQDFHKNEVLINKCNAEEADTKLVQHEISQGGYQHSGTYCRH